MTRYPRAIQELVDRFRRLPGVGPKTALRFSFAALRWADADRRALADALLAVARETTRCDTCANIAESNPCRLCSDPARDGGVICVVAEPQHLAAIEATGAFRGRYHVLGGVISPLDGINPDRLTIGALEIRIRVSQPTPVREILLALEPSIEGETTMLYLAKRLASLGIAITRLARGLPVGADLEYADEITLGDALRGRRIMS